MIAEWNLRPRYVGRKACSVLVEKSLISFSQVTLTASVLAQFSMNWIRDIISPRPREFIINFLVWSPQCQLIFSKFMKNRGAEAIQNSRSHLCIRGVAQGD